MYRNQGHTQDFLKGGQGLDPKIPTPEIYFLLGFRPLLFSKLEKIKIYNRNKKVVKFHS